MLRKNLVFGQNQHLNYLRDFDILFDNIQGSKFYIKVLFLTKNLIVPQHFHYVYIRSKNSNNQVLV